MSEEERDIQAPAEGFSVGATRDIAVFVVVALVVVGVMIASVLAFLP
jgi:hypothetical protein